MQSCELAWENQFLNCRWIYGQGQKYTLTYPISETCNRFGVSRVIQAVLRCAQFLLQRKKPLSICISTHACYGDSGAFGTLKLTLYSYEDLDYYSLKYMYLGYYLFGVHLSVAPASSLGACSVLTDRNVNKQGEKSRRRSETYLFCNHVAPELHTRKPYVLFGYPFVMSTRIPRRKAHGPFSLRSGMPPVVCAHWRQHALHRGK